MKVLMLNTFDELGGAARAAGRLKQGLRKLEVDVRMLVQFKAGVEPDVICKGGLLRKLGRRVKLFLGVLPVRMYPNKPENNFSPSLLPGRVSAQVAEIDPDVVHLHWLCAGFLRVETLRKLKRTLVWTLHDSWAFTGGCHVPFDCTRYRQNCGACPVLGSSRERDLSRWTWGRKERAWRGLDLTVVAPSRWLADCARSSSLFRDVRVEVIPNGLDTETFQPVDKKHSRSVLGLPQDKKIILFGAMRGISDPNKGFHLLRSALRVIGKGSANTLAVVFSSLDRAETLDLGMPVIFLGHIRDNILIETYSAADVYVAPSMQEAFCQTAAEAMACGTPVVAFGATGLLDVVEHQRCGYLAEPYDSEELAKGIAWVLEDTDRHAELSFRARRKVEAEFSIDEISRRYIDLYRELMRKRSPESVFRGK